MSLPRVSVIIAARNAASTLAETLRAILAQDYRGFEVLVGDDASTDATAMVARAFSGVRYFRNAHRRGASATRNRLIAEARGRYLSFCDADDLLLPGNLRKLARVLDASADVGLVYASSLVVEPGGFGRIVGRALDDDLQTPFCALCLGAMVRRRLVTRLGGFRVDLPLAEDNDLWYRLGEITRFEYLPREILHVYRRKPHRRSAAHDLGRAKLAALCRRYEKKASTNRRHARGAR